MIVIKSFGNLMWNLAVNISTPFHHRLDKEERRSEEKQIIWICMGSKIYMP